MTRWCEHDSGRELPDDDDTAWPDRMRADLTRLEAAFPAFSFAIRRGLRGFTFEAWRDSMAAGLYAVITADPGELWRELVAGAAVAGTLAAETGEWISSPFPSPAAWGNSNIVGQNTLYQG